ncbi:MAG: GTPase [Rhodospirillales bacterium]
MPNAGKVDVPCRRLSRPAEGRGLPPRCGRRWALPASGDELVVADIPGLIEGAHAGIGLGTRFLGHVERCRVLIHLIDGTIDDPAAAWRTVRAELLAYGAGLARKPEIRRAQQDRCAAGRRRL